VGRTVAQTLMAVIYALEAGYAYRAGASVCTETRRKKQFPYYDPSDVILVQ